MLNCICNIPQVTHESRDLYLFLKIYLII
jgi:hypothetical protein